MSDAAVRVTRSRARAPGPVLALGIGLAASLATAWAAPTPLASASAPAPRPSPAPSPSRTSPDGIEWKALTAPQRQALAPLERDWSNFDAAQKLKWVELAQRFPQLSAAERTRIQERMADWARMTPAERGQARLRYLQARRAAPDGRGARWEDYQALPSEQKEKLAARAVSPAASGSVAARPGANGKAQGSVKSNLVTSPAFPLPPKPVAPTVIQARPGATTTLVSKQPAPPAHQQVGLPKIAATPGFIDKYTLLPQRGPQGAATLSVNDAGTDLEPVPRP